MATETLTISAAGSVSTATVFVSSTSTITYTFTSESETELFFTQYLTDTDSVTLDSTVTLSVADTTYQTAFATVTGIQATSVVYETVTVTAAGTSVTTVTVPVPTFVLQMVPTNGGASLYYMALTGDGVVSKGTTDITQASLLTVDSLNRLVTTAADPEIACESNSIANYYVNNVRPSFLNAHPTYQSIFKPLTCTINVGLTLTCTYKTANAFTLYNNQWFYSTAGYNGYPTYVGHVIPV